MASNKDDQGNQDDAKLEKKQISHANGNVEDWQAGLDDRPFV